MRPTHRPEHPREALKRSLASLKTDKIDMWYLHASDRSTPNEDALREVNTCIRKATSTFWDKQLKVAGSGRND